ncbi:MAG: Transketolase domain protein, partial [Conexibacter sp.]|nr:Transketolase domain protein [Conexibacter sp.]
MLWLAVALVQHGRAAGAPAAAASMTSIMAALWLGLLEAADRVVVKPQAMPVLRALEQLLGSTAVAHPEGSGATAAVWSALARRYVATHGGAAAGEPVAGPGRQIALLGEAELDGGACWEALAEPKVPLLGELLWIVDLDRQSLDHVVPDVRAGRLRHAFEAAGWHAITLKYGRGLQALFQRTGGGDLCRRLDRMDNAEFQRLLGADADGLRAGLPGLGPGRRAIARLVSQLDDRELRGAIRDVGGHDLAALLDAYRAADAVRDRPAVIFAHTIRGWSLPLETQPSRHALPLTATQYARLAQELGVDPAAPWEVLPPGSAARALCDAAAIRLARPGADG